MPDTSLVMPGPTFVMTGHSLVIPGHTRVMPGPTGHLLPPGANQPLFAPGNRFFSSPGANQPLSAPGNGRLETKEQCETFEDRFLFIMKNLPTFVETPELWADGDPYFRELLQEAEFANMTDRQLERYLVRMKPLWDNENAMEYAKEKAWEKGEAKGEAKRAIETARQMLADNKPIDEIVRYSGLTEEQILAL